MEIVIDGVPVLALSLAALLAVKRESARPKDRAQVPLLEALLRRLGG